jgi:hypothetical protein
MFAIPSTITDFLIGTSVLAPRHHWQHLRQAFLATLCAGVLAAVVVGYPLGAVWLGAILLAWCAVLRRWPQAWLLLVPAALPVADLAPWTGRFFLDEFDALLAATLLMHAWRRPAPAPAAGWRMTAPARGALALFCLSSCIALIIGAWPFPVPVLNGLNHYYSPYNGVRLAKGLAWALLLWPLLREALAADVVKTQRRFALGMGVGVFAAALGVVAERAAFPGVFDFDSGYRAVGLFFAMHTGGAYIEAYFALALPFLAWWTLGSRSRPARFAGAAMLALGIYALLVTYARAGYLAAALAMLVLAVSARSALRPRRAALLFSLLLALTALLGLTIGQGKAMQRRYASTGHDLAVRAAHWADAVRMIDRTPAAWMAGTGLGRYPATYFLRSGEGATPSYLALQRDNGNTWLALAAGAPLYFEQIVSVQPNQRYHLSLRARSADRDAELSVPLCEKWMLYSRRCVWQSVAIGDTGGAWRRFAVSFRTPGPLPRGALRPVKLSLFSQAEGSALDIDDLSLQDDDGHELLRNGGFEQGTNRWFFSTDNHMPWHLENTWLQLAFEQGLLGVAAFGALLLCAIAALVRRLRARDPYAPVLAATMAAFLALSPLDSLFDFPHIAILVYLILLHTLSDVKKTMP